MGRMTRRKKREYYPDKIKDDGYQCLFCKEPFIDKNPPEWDHLNNNPNDSRYENVALIHKTCNNKKKFNPDYQIIAHEKLLENERAVLVCERRQADTGTTQDLTSSQQISKALRPIAFQWIEKHTLIEKEILLKDAVNAIVFLCQKQTGWGSPATIYRYIDECTNRYYGKFTLSTNEAGKTIIRRRTEN